MASKKNLQTKKWNLNTEEDVKRRKICRNRSRIRINKRKKEEIQAKMDEYKTFRKEKQPIEYPSAGSTFKRGADFITAKLIDEAELKDIQLEMQKYQQNTQDL